MRRLTVSLAVLLTFAAAGCKRAAKHSQSGEDLISVVAMDDPHADFQLVSGFYSLEGNPWRWTAAKFSADLKPPAGAGQNGARLELKLNVPDVLIQQIGAITLSATANGVRLAPQKFAAAGDYVYAADVPADVLRAGSVTVDFSTDKAIPP
ncbi:MAG TPA: hypothetical protein VGJ09_08510, partial [Bryobacteraceae bacterium]